MGGAWQNLESRNWVSGGNVNFSMDGLPPQTRVRSLQITFDLVGTKNAADVLNGDQFPKLFNNLKLGNFVSIGGVELAKLMWAVNGHMPEDPLANYSITNTSATTFRLYFTLDVYLRDPRQSGSDDGSLPSELLSSRGMEIVCNSGNVFGVGSLVVNSGTIRVAVERIHETNVPMLTRIGYNDASSQTIRLESGVYKELFICKTDGTTLSNTDIVSVDVIADGKPVLQNMRFEQLITAWNRTAARNGNSSSRCELARDTAAFLPLIWHDNSGKSNITKQPLVEKDLLIQINGGALTTPRFVYWRAVPKDTATIAQIAKVIGAPPDATTYEPAVASKTPPHAAKAGETPSRKVTAMYSILPGKFRSTPTPGNKLG